MKLWEKVMNEMSPDLIAGAMEQEKEAAAPHGSRLRLMKRWIPAAACLMLGLLLIGGGVLFFRGRKTQPETESAVPQDYGAIWAAAQSGLIQESFWVSYHTEIPDGPFAGYQSSRICDAALVGEKLGDASVSGAWYRIAREFRPESGKEELSKEPEGSPETLRAEVFAIRGVAPETAVCLKYLDRSEAVSTDHYITFLNPAADFAALSAFFGAAQAAERTDLIRQEGITSLMIETASGSGVTRRSYFTDESAAAAIVGTLLACDGPAADAEEETILSACRQRASFRIGIEGIGNWAVTVYGSGYLKLELAGVHAGLFAEGLARVFAIGVAPAENLIRLMEQRGTAYVPQEDGTITWYTEAARP